MKKKWLLCFLLFCFNFLFSIDKDDYWKQKKAFSDSLKKSLASTENQISELEERNKLYNLKIKTDLVNKQVESQKKELRKRTVIGKMLGLLSLLALLFVGIIRNKKKEAKRILDKINEQNKQVQQSIQTLHKTQQKKIVLEEKNRQYIVALKTYENLKPSLDYLKQSIEKMDDIPEKKKKKIWDAFQTLNETVLKYKNAVEIVRVKYTDQEEMLEIN